MRIFYDYQIFQHQIYGGISRYFFELINGIESDHADVEYMLPLISSSNGYIKNINAIASGIKSGSDYYHQFLGNIEFPGKWKVFQAWTKQFPGSQLRNQKATIEALKNRHFDLFHPTDVHDYFLPYLNNRPFVITVHDMIDEYFPEYSFHVYTEYKTSIKAQLIQKAKGIIAVSNSTRNDILNRFDVDEKKIKVIYHGTSELASETNIIDPIVKGGYFLFVGKRTHYKNFYFLLQCMQPFLQHTELKMVCAGSSFNATELAYFKDLGLDKNLVALNVDDNDLANLYRNAIAFIYPSLYEGFGMPILEAFKNRCPVLLSNTSSLPEVAGTAGLYFNPKDIGSIRSSVEKILTDKDLREDLVAKGIDRIKLFSWRKTLDETLSFYKTLV